jgi:hypothetical protein
VSPTQTTMAVRSGPIDNKEWLSEDLGVEQEGKKRPRRSAGRTTRKNSRDRHASSLQKRRSRKNDAKIDALAAEGIPIDARGPIWFSRGSAIRVNDGSRLWPGPVLKIRSDLFASGNRGSQGWTGDPRRPCREIRPLAREREDLRKKNPILLRALSSSGTSVLL